MPVEKMRFWKYHGTGNDFVLVDAPRGRPGWLTPEAVTAICDRHFGIGADGVLLIEPGDEAPHFMRVLNADGSEAEMCGNGIRCVARHLKEVTGVDGELLKIQTLAGVKDCRVTLDPATERVGSVAVGLGAPVTSKAGIPVIGTGESSEITVSALGREFKGWAVGMGNPHFVVFEGLDEHDASRYGRVLSTSPLFPNQANIEFAAHVDEDRFDVRVYERGVGLTLACGTGAGAVAAAAVLSGRSGTGRRIRIDLPGGTLYLTVEHGMTDVVLEGPATLVFQGETALFPALEGSGPAGGHGGT